MLNMLEKHHYYGIILENAFSIKKEKKEKEKKMSKSKYTMTNI